jgi:cadmium resistance protein CadD (predicted permease)
VFAVSAVTLANGGDNIGVYVPLFSISSAGEKAILVTTFLVMTGLWCVFAHWLVNHRAVGKPIRKYGHLLLPWVLIGLGISILARAKTWSLLRYL